jgi:hypothetical protein
MSEVRRALALLAALAAPTMIHAQVVAPAPGMPPNPYERPREMDANDQLLNSPNDYLRRGVQNSNTDQLAKDAKSGGRTRPAKADEVVAGAQLLDKAGVAIGTIESVAADGAVVATLTGKVKIPLEAFGINKKGLLVDLSKKEFDTLVAQANGG